MARFIPSVTPEDFNNSYGEKRVYESLKTLGDNYTVFYSLSWVGLNEYRTLGEADFVVVHPQKGILVIEVKSGEISYKDGEWIQTNTLSRVSKRISPYNQARKSQYELLDRIYAANLEFKIPLICYAVWFPSITVSDKINLPLDSDKAITFDEVSLAEPERAINDAFDYWLSKKDYKTRYQELDNRHYEELIGVICPHFHIVPRLKTKNDEMEQTYIQLTNQQIHLLDFLEEQKTAVIHGAAGTGKTVLAIEKAKRLAERNDKVLFLCFNAFLRDYLKQLNLNSNIVFHNAHSLAYAMMGFDGTPEDTLKEFEDFLEIVYDEDSWEYKDIIVDEGQDLSDRLLNRLYELVKKKKGCFYAFYDRNQYIMKNTPSKWIENAECRLVLNKNCRNTAEIFKTSCSIIGLENIKSNDIHGDTPLLAFYSSEAEMNMKLIGIIKDLISEGVDLSNIVILSAGTIEGSWVDVDSLTQIVQLSEKREPGKVLFTTIRKFKGLEADVVIIVDSLMSDLTIPESRRLLYTGASRAKHLLYVLMQEDVYEDSYGIFINKIAPDRHVPKNKKGLKRLLNVDIRL